ncbi:hypothetical protein [Collinsella sp. TM05-37]|uniref:hypothetical protein n=1 Tax=Collinsella sp. TM05-37 TaxID=2292340 RepID=UPI002101CA2C|nr:hypothetical protein [Collinsella sp. TM05-37]
MYENGNVQGFTTNPSLMKKGGVTDYRAFAKEVRPTSPMCPCRLRSLPTTSRPWRSRRARSLPGPRTSTSRFRA